MIYIIIILLISYLCYNSIVEQFSYRLCKKRNVFGLHKVVLNKHKLKRTDDNEWNLYLPCGYKFVEKEITNMTMNSTNTHIFGISGSDNIASKNNLWKILRDYYGVTEASEIMPITYILQDPEDMLSFNKTYSNNKTYILKKNIQRKEGLKLVKGNIKEILDAKKEDYKIVQEYIKNPFLVNGYKLNIRLFMLIVCNGNNKRIYVHKSGKCLYTLKKYKANMDFHSNITSYNADKNIYHSNPLSLEQLRMYLTQNNYNDIQVFESIRGIMSKLGSAIKNHVCNKKCLHNVTAFQLFGVDVILDDKMNPKVLEINKGPNMRYVNKEDRELKENVYEDVYKNVNIIESEFNGFEEV